MPARDDRRLANFRAALGFMQIPPRAPELRLLHRRLDSLGCIGLVVVSMAHQGYQVSLGEHGTARWIAVFYRAGGGHEPVVAAGTAQEATAWRAVQRAHCPHVLMAMASGYDVVGVQSGVDAATSAMNEAARTGAFCTLGVGAASLPCCETSASRAFPFKCIGHAAVSRRGLLTPTSASLTL
jgi:hypothetical protein